jgi:hypothetical protein
MMIRSALQRLAEKDSPAWLVRHIPDAVWNWAFEATPTEALLQQAHVQLLARPEITVYDFEDGQEINRRTANPWARLQLALKGVTAAMEKAKWQRCGDDWTRLADHASEPWVKKTCTEFASWSYGMADFFGGVRMTRPTIPKSNSGGKEFA